MTEKVTLNFEKNLTLDAIIQFLSSSDEVNKFAVLINDSLECSYAKSSTIECFEYLTALSNSDDDKLTFVNEKIKLHITFWDIRWWTKTSKRLDKIRAIINTSEVVQKSIKQTKKEVKTIDTYTLACATLLEGKLTNVVVFTGTKSEAIDFMNTQIKQRVIDTFLQSKPVFNLAYEEHSEENIADWLSIDELIEIGAVTIS